MPRADEFMEQNAEAERLVIEVSASVLTRLANAIDSALARYAQHPERVLNEALREATFELVQNYKTAERLINIRYEGGIGGFTVRFV